MKLIKWRCPVCNNVAWASPGMPMYCVGTRRSFFRRLPHNVAMIPVAERML